MKEIKITDEDLTTFIEADGLKSAGESLIEKAAKRTHQAWIGLRQKYSITGEGIGLTISKVDKKLYVAESFEDLAKLKPKQQEQVFDGSGGKK